jgi:putative redox protein
MVAISIDYQGELHCQAEHGPSGTTLTTDAPADNGGLAASFSPTDLIATALGTCILTTMGLKAQALGVDISGSSAVVEKVMTPAPRRIGALTTIVTVPQQFPDAVREQLEQAALGCPVKKTISETVEMPVEFVWG